MQLLTLRPCEGSCCLSFIGEKQEDVELADGNQEVRQGTMCFQWLVCVDCTLRGLPQACPCPRPSRLFSEAVMETFRLSL